MASQIVLKQEGRKKIGDGCDTRIDKIPWLPYHKNGYLTTEVQ